MKTLFKNLPIIFLVLAVIAFINTGGASSIVFWSMVILANIFACTHVLIRAFISISEELHKKSAIAHAKIMDKLLTEQADYILTKTESDKKKDNKSKINKNTSDEDFEKDLTSLLQKYGMSEDNVSLEKVSAEEFENIKRKYQENSNDENSEDEDTDTMEIDCVSLINKNKR